MKRRAIATGIAGLSLLVACAPAAPTATPAPKVVATTVPPKKGIYYFLAGNNQDPFYVPGVQGLRDAAASLGFQAEFVGPMDANLAEHIKIFEQLNASADTAGIFLYPWDANSQGPLIREAKAKGIPLVIGAADMVGKDRDAFIGYDNALLGQQAGAWIAKILNGKGKVGSMGNTGSNVVQRQDAMAAYLKASAPGITVVERAIYDTSTDAAIKNLDAYLVAHPDLSLLWFADGGASRMVQPWKERQEAGKKTLFLGMDMPEATMKAVKDGIFVGSVGQDTYTEAYWGVLLLDQIRQKKRVPDTLYLGAILLDKSNVDQFLGK